MLIAAALLALGVGVIMGLLGGGGSLLTLPVLVYGLAIPTKTAIATSQLLVAATSCVAMGLHARQGRVAWRTGLLFSVASMVGAYGGGRLAVRIAPAALMIAFGAIMLLAASAMLFPLFPRRDDEPSDARIEIAKVFAIGFPVGIVAGLLGAGGGFLTVPVLNLFGGLPMTRAIGTSLLIITLQSMAGFAGQASHVTIDWSLVALLCACSASGSLLGAQLTGRVKPERLRKSFGVLIALVGVGVLAKQIVELVSAG